MMRLRWNWLFSFLLIAGFLCMSAVEAQGENLLENGDFTQGWRDIPEAWSTYAWEQGDAFTEFYRDPEVYRTGGFSGAIVSHLPNDARFLQEVPLKADTYYRISGWIKTLEVGREAVGANLSVSGRLDRSQDFVGTQDWQYAVLYVYSGAEAQTMTVTAGIGGYGSLNSGQAWFDELAVVALDHRPAGVAIAQLTDAPPGRERMGLPRADAAPLRWFLYLSYGLFLAAILVFRRLSKKGGGMETGAKRQWLRGLFGAGILIRIFFAVLTEGFSVDINLFRFWAEAGARDLFGIYHGGFFLDYPPLYLYVLSGVARLARLLGTLPGSALYTLLLKAPSMAADVVTAYLLYRLAKDRLPEGWRLFAAGIYLLNPAVLINSALWGQVDSFMTLWLALGFYTLSGKGSYLSGVFFAAAVLTKPQGLIFMPVVLFELLKQRDMRLLLKTALIGIGTGILIILPFALRQDPFWIVRLYINTASGYQYVSLNAFNFFALIGANLKPDGVTWFLFTYRTWGFIFIFLVTGYTGLIYWRGKGAHLPYLACALMAIGIFMLSVRMHERYLFPLLFFLLMVLIYTGHKWCLVFFGAASATVLLNTYDVYLRMAVDQYPHVPPTAPSLLLISGMNMVLFVWMVYWAWKHCDRETEADSLWLQGAAVKSPPVHRRHRCTYASKPEPEPYRPMQLKRLDYVLMALMTAVYLAGAFINLGSRDIPSTPYVSQELGEGFILDLGEAREVHRINYFAGLGNGAYAVSYQSAEGASVDLPDMEAENKDFYKWRVIPVYAVTRYIQAEAKQPGGELLEIAVYGPDTRVPLPVTLLDLDRNPVTEGTRRHLTDEQHKAAFRPSFLNGTYFDEIYHARTAYEHLHGIRPYEWTHPPLGKLLIGAGIALFGMNPFGWRIVGMLFGAAMIPLMYLFGKKLFNTPLLGFAAACLMMFDLMHFAQTRIATIDGYTAFFVILMYYFMAEYYLQKPFALSYRKALKPLFLCGLCFGLGVAVKWSAVYGAPGLALLFFLTKAREYEAYRMEMERPQGRRASWTEQFWSLYIQRTLLWCVLFFVLIPAGIYFLSYIPYLQVPGMTVSDILNYQRQMYHYHSRLTATHPFTSPWWSWPLMIRPIWYYRGVDLPAGMASTIASFGNPAVWWPGIPAAFYGIKAALKGNRALMLVIVAIAAQYLPWILVPRIAFIYHFFPILPFVMLTLVYAWKVLLEQGWPKSCLYGYLVLAAVLFLMFYPAVSGLVVPEDYIRFLRWFDTWVF